MVHELFDITGKTALVTGGASGMGRMIAEGLLRAGAKVYITSRKASECTQAAEQMMELGNCYPITAELDTADAVIGLAEHVKASENQLDILVNNAGRTWGAPLKSFPDTAWAPVMAVNVQAPFTLVRELLPLLKVAGSISKSDPGRVINIGSLAGKCVESLSAYSYSASKAALHFLSRELAAELAGDNITVNTIVPGYFPTKMTAHIRSEDETASNLTRRIPLSRLGTPDDITGTCIFLSSRAGAYVTGAELVLDGGLQG